jgi:alpha-ketoglutarate-dependent taurine dioxygenase
VQNAAAGGANELLDHEMLYILMRDADPRHVRALAAPDAMTIPANREGDREIRPDSVGPVFSTDPRTGALHMRYSARKRNVRWKDDHATRAALAWLADLFSAGSAHIFRHRLEPGQGILSNNVLHRREGFEDDAATGMSRVFLRARYYDRVAGT